MNLEGAARYIARLHPGVESEDLLQEERLAQLTGRSHGDGAMRDYLRRSAPGYRAGGRFVQWVPERGYSPEREYVRRLDAQRFLDQLSPREASIFRMKFFDGRENEEIAERLGLSYFNVRMIYARAVARLRARHLFPQD